MIIFNSTYVYKTIETKDDFIVFSERDLNFIAKNYNKVLFINIKTKELMLISLNELIDYKTTATSIYSQVLFIPNIENYFTDIDLHLIFRFHHTWYNLLSDYITTNKFMSVLIEITNQSKDYRIYPDVQDRFKMFNIQNFNDIKVVLVSLDPYISDDATGIGFATKNNKKPVSLKTIEKELQKQFQSINRLDNSLIPLVNQGVMFLNSALTGRMNKNTGQKEVGEHLVLWEDFLSYVMNKLDNKLESIIFVFLGSKAGRAAKYIKSPIHYKLFVEHPAKPSYEYREWETDNLFININNVLSVSQNDIIWI